MTHAPSMSAADFLSDLKWRGLVANSTDSDALEQALAAGPLTLYCGFDPTAESLHVGNLVPLLTLRRFQQQGHHPIALVGGATGLIGDPSGRTAERSLNSAETVAAWVDNIRNQVAAFLELSGDNAATVVSNLDWTQQLSAIEFLRDIGKHFSVNVMLAKDSVKSRLNDAGISYTEFSYMLLQAYDYLELFRRHDCRLQIGGSDQWGNIVAGLDLIRREAGPDAPSAHALTVPLITKADGTKFGKTASGAVWLDASLTSPYEFYQFWINADDRDVASFLKVFSFRSQAQIQEILDEHDAAPHQRSAQRALADELTALVHGEDEMTAARAAGHALFGRGDLAQLPVATVAAALQTAPNAQFSFEGEWPTVVDLLVLSGLSEGRKAARRALSEGGAYVNNERVTSDTVRFTDAELLHGRWWLVRRGKKAFAAVECIR